MHVGFGRGVRSHGVFMCFALRLDSLLLVGGTLFFLQAFAVAYLRGGALLGLRSSACCLCDLALSSLGLFDSESLGLFAREPLGFDLLTSRLLAPLAFLPLLALLCFTLMTGPLRLLRLGPGLRLMLLAGPLLLLGSRPGLGFLSLVRDSGRFGLGLGTSLRLLRLALLAFELIAFALLTFGFLAPLRSSARRTSSRRARSAFSAARFAAAASRSLRLLLLGLFTLTAAFVALLAATFLLDAAPFELDLLGLDLRFAQGPRRRGRRAEQAERWRRSGDGFPSGA